MKIRTNPLEAIIARQTLEDTKYVDLGPFYNFAISEEIHGKPGNTIPLKQGVDDYNGVNFDVRGIIQLSSKLAFEKSHILYPEKVSGIPVNLRARELCFLHSSAWESKKGADVVKIVVHYTDHQARDLTIRYQEEVEDWWFMTGKSIFPVNAQLAWEGSNTRVKEIGFELKLYRFTWANPLPEIEISTVDLISSMNETGYMLYGITCL
jgi:hypothetical protein